MANRSLHSLPPVRHYRFGPDCPTNKASYNGRRAWPECYLAPRDIHECDTLTHFQVYPHPEATRLQENLDFLERNHLNLYVDSR
jgi:hypothetical protein